MLKILDKLTTERRNRNTMYIDQLNTLDMVTLINQEDFAVIEAVKNALPEIAQAVDSIYDVISKGGRLVYIGAGTSGRLGVLDASEWYPTYGVGHESVIGIIAGGDRALRHPIEGAEDNKEAAVEDLKNLNFNDSDILCAIASSGRTPYCVSGLEYAKSIGAKTIAIACVKDSIIGTKADIAIEAVTGEEVITGSTRMKAGSAQKMILNMISTSTMIKYGKVYSNLMVDLNPSNEKLVARAHSIITTATGVSIERAEKLLKDAKNSVKVAIVMGISDLSYEDAIKALEVHHGRISDVIKE